MTIKAKKSKINLREKLAELLNFRQIRDRLDGLGLYLGKDRTGTAENLAVRGGANVDDLQLAEISAALGGTAVDVFVYDTRNDSDGGKWRERTQNTSWYNEELNTTTRGGRREFPAVAVIVAEAGKVTIYDGDDPDLGMWMVFEATFNMNLITATTGTTISSLSALNGIVCVGVNGSSPHLTPIDFISEKSGHYTTAGNKYFLFDISKRNNTNSPAHGSYDSTVAIVSSVVNDVAMTVLPNAPIDTETGLPVPTIAVATDGGVSVIKDDGSVVDKGTTSAAVNQVQWMGSSRLVATAPGYYGVFDDPFVEESAAFLGYISDNVYYHDHTKNHLYQVPNIIAQLDANSKLLTLDTRTIIASTSAGLDVHEMGEGAAANNNHGIATYITSEYNTGWMPGDIKLATLSDTKIEKVGVDETNSVIDNGESWSGVSDATTEPTGWTLESAGSANYSVANGELTISQTGATPAKIYQSFDVVKGGVYDVEVKYKANFGTARYQVADNAISSGGAITLVDIITTSYVTERKTFRAETTGKYSIGISCYGTGASATFDYVTIKQTGELITNGTFDDGTEGWDSGVRLDVTISPDNDQAKVLGSGSSLLIHQQMSGLQIGKKYTVSARVTPFIGASGAFWQFYLSTGYTNGIGQISIDDQVPTEISSSFVATAVDQDISFGASSGAITPGEYFLIDNISVRLAEDDRSVNDNGLQIFGEIDKTPVAPGADLVAYSGFSADNYLMQPYNADLDFGTGDFCIMGWFKSYASSNAGIIYSRRPQSSNINGLEIGVTTDGTLYVYTIEDSVINSSSTPLSGKPITRNVWNNFCAVRSGETINLYVNGVLHSSTTNTIRNLTNPSAELCLGVYGDQSSFAFNGEISLIRASATVPTDAQIAKIYRDEKALFTDGAQATLYGTSDAVTALAYDDKTELLHVGTSGGRSDFAGLRRINNTTIPVTTSISASNNLIAEQ